MVLLLLIMKRYVLTQKLSTMFLFLMETRISYMIENVAKTCGSIEGGVAWLLSTFVNSYCDLLRSIGIRCVGAYVRATRHGPDLPLSFPLENISPLDRHKNVRVGSGNIKESTMSLITNVGQGFLTTNDRKTTLVNRTNTNSQLTPRVIYKLLWHLIKSHRHRMGKYTQASLVRLVFERKDSVFLSQDYLMKHLITMDESIPGVTNFRFDWAKSSIADIDIDMDGKINIRDTLSLNTILRVLRFLPSEYSSEWLLILVELIRSNNAATTIASCRDWQSCLFQYISEMIENLTNVMTPKNNETEKIESQQETAEIELKKVLEMSLELYSTLLGYLIRVGNEMVRNRNPFYVNIFASLFSDFCFFSGYWRVGEDSRITKSLREWIRGFCFYSKLSVCKSFQIRSDVIRWETTAKKYDRSG